MCVCVRACVCVHACAYSGKARRLKQAREEAASEVDLCRRKQEEEFRALIAQVLSSVYVTMHLEGEGVLVFVCRLLGIARGRRSW